MYLAFFYFYIRTEAQNGQYAASVCWYESGVFVCVNCVKILCVVQAHVDLCANLVQSHQKALMELQENSSKMIHQHTETAQHLREVPQHYTQLHNTTQHNIYKISQYYCGV